MVRYRTIIRYNGRHYVRTVSVRRSKRNGEWNHMPWFGTVKIDGKRRRVAHQGYWGFVVIDE